MLPAKSILVLILVTFLFSCATQEQDIIKWKFETNGKVYSHPIIKDNTIYFGSMDSVFYAVNATDGRKIWSIKTNAPIQSKALIHDNIVYFKGGNNAYALDKEKGSLVWSSTCDDSVKTGQIDPWDYHSGSPAIYKDHIYFGFENGKLLGYNLKNGAIEAEFAKEDTAAIKSEVHIENNVLFYGDWNGKVHAYNLDTGEELWVHTTYEQRLYPTFGPINTELELANGNLYYGARNPEIKVLNQETGNIVWSFEEKEGGWISGDPMVYNDTFYIGGSDNHEMLAFNAITGEKLWSYLFLNNNFSKPLIYNKYLLFTTGDAYNVWGDKAGRGYLYALNRKDGTIKNFEYIGGNVYSSIFLDKHTLYCGSSDKNLYAINLKQFLNEESKLERKGYKAFEFVEITPYAFDSITEIKYTVKYNTNIKIRITDIKEDEVVILSELMNESGEHSIKWNGHDEQDKEVSDGYYFVEITAHDFVMKSFVQKKSDDHKD